MDAKPNLFNLMTRRMAWLGQRQQVLAQNIANADTPNYVPYDLKEGRFAKLLAPKLQAVRMAATQPAHIAKAPPGGGDAYRPKEQAEVYEIAPSGNAVTLEEQLVKVQETQLDYQTMTNLYRKHMNMIRIALGRGGGA